MRSWRARLTCDGIPGLRSQRPNRRGDDVSQADMAWLTDVTEVWYATLESGKLATYSDEFLDRVAGALRLSHHERTVLYYLALGREPRPRPQLPQPALQSVSPAVRQLLDALPWPACVADSSFELLANNQALEDWLPYFRWERNVMAWVFKYPESRVQLIDWETVWAPVMLAQMRAAKARMPQNVALGQLVDECLAANEFARNLWDTQPEVSIHPDGDVRQLYLPYSEDKPTKVEVVALAPMRNADTRVVMFVPIDGFVPPPPAAGS
ncbi:MmyB family transcriptional regulator [Rhizocola hellebori]|nr:helix-turn-helix domain-containing protein [Rhizocola hellebori]